MAIQRLSIQAGMSCQFVFFLFLASLALTGCSGFARGVTEAILERQEKEDTRTCYIRGRAFAGLGTYLAEQGTVAGEEDKILKILMVHGIGSHQPGYSTQLAETLARSLELPRVQEKYKEIQLTNSRFPGINLGSLRASRYLSQNGEKEMIFFELTWDPIVEAEKKLIDFDNSGEYAFRRTELNNILKLFVNSTVPDVVMYYGEAQDQIQASVGQSLCWMLSETWDGLPDQEAAFCDPSLKKNLDRIQDDYAFITHSLGSRVTTDALQRIASLAKEDPHMVQQVDLLKNKKFNIYMLSNQLPLLQLGQPQPEVHGQIQQICEPQSPRANERLFQETRLIAFSDPNDLFSYAIPPRFLDEKIDSRICPVLTNVVLNVAPLADLFGLSEVANPMTAHTGYDKDDRVIELLSKGIGGDIPSSKISEYCEWLEVVPEGKW